MDTTFRMVPKTNLCIVEANDKNPTYCLPFPSGRAGRVTGKVGNAATTSQSGSDRP